MSYWIHPEAEAERGDAAVYYAAHASLAVAQAFIAEFERVRDLLVENQGRGAHGDHGFRAITSTGFRTRSSTKRINRPGPKSMLWPISTVSQAIG